MKQLIISGGIYKNHKITFPSGEIRPVMNLVREAIFQILGNRFHILSTREQDDQVISDNAIYQKEKLNFLDLFSGSGLMAIEAISRGFSHATSVEIDKKKWSVIQDNIIIGEHSIHLAKESAERFLLRNNKPFDIIYVDPPFRYKYKNDLMKKIVKSRACSDSSIIIMHMPKREDIIDAYDGFMKIDSRNYGGSAIHIYAHHESNTR